MHIQTDGATRSLCAEQAGASQWSQLEIKMNLRGTTQMTTHSHIEQNRPSYGVELTNAPAVSNLYRSHCEVDMPMCRAALEFDGLGVSALVIQGWGAELFKVMGSEAELFKIVMCLRVRGGDLACSCREADRGVPAP